MYYTNDEGVQEQIEEDKLNLLWQQGALTPKTLCWKDGMPDWVSAAEFFSGTTAVASAAQPKGYSYAKDPKTLTKLLIVMLWVSLAMEIVSMLANFGQLSLVSREYTIQEAEANDSRIVVIGGVYLLNFIVTGIIFLKWIYRAHINARGFGAQGMTHTPGWAVGSFFIPILCLFRPYQAMRQLWQTSRDPLNWEVQEAGAVLPVWWTLWIISSILGQVIFRMDAGTVDEIKTSTMVSISSDIVGVLLCLVAITLVKTISRMQEDLVGGRSPGARAVGA